MTKNNVLPESIDRFIQTVPDECPICHQKIRPEYVTHYPKTPDAAYHKGFHIVFACPSSECEHVFVAYYELIGQVQQFVAALPRIPKTPEVPASVAAISKRFVKVYTEAEAAHSYQLDEVAGGGYRKALEVLVKDFLIVRGIKDEPTVIKMNLHDAIKALPSEVATNLAYFAKLLGNDETHFYRELTGKDIEDVMKYLKATITALDLYLMHEEGVGEFGTPK